MQQPRKSMEQGDKWEVPRSSTSQEIPRIYTAQKFITVSVTARHLSYREPH
jgi:hypothetical protein